mgnify:CR=1 FL=1
MPISPPLAIADCRKRPGPPKLSNMSRTLSSISARSLIAAFLVLVASACADYATQKEMASLPEGKLSPLGATLLRENGQDEATFSDATHRRTYATSLPWQEVLAYYDEELGSRGYTRLGNGTETRGWITITFSRPGQTYIQLSGPTNAMTGDYEFSVLVSSRKGKR